MPRFFAIFVLVSMFCLSSCDQKPVAPSVSGDAGQAQSEEMRDNDPNTGHIPNVNKELRELKVDLNEKSTDREANIEAKIAQ